MKIIFNIDNKEYNLPQIAEIKEIKAKWSARLYTYIDGKAISIVGDNVHCIGIIQENISGENNFNHTTQTLTKVFKAVEWYCSDKCYEDILNFIQSGSKNNSYKRLCGSVDATIVKGGGRWGDDAVRGNITMTKDSVGECDNLEPIVDLRYWLEKDAKELLKLEDLKNKDNNDTIDNKQYSEEEFKKIREYCRCEVKYYQSADKLNIW